MRRAILIMAIAGASQAATSPADRMMVAIDKIITATETMNQEWGEVCLSVSGFIEKDSNRKVAAGLCNHIHQIYAEALRESNKERK